MKFAMIAALLAVSVAPATTSSKSVLSGLTSVTDMKAGVHKNLTGTRMIKKCFPDCGDSGM